MARKMLEAPFRKCYDLAFAGSYSQFLKYMDALPREDRSRLVNTVDKAPKQAQDDNESGDFNSTILLAAIASGSYSVVKYLVEKCEASIELRGDIYLENEVIQMAPPLWAACAFRKRPIIEMLVGLGAKIDGRAKKMSTPLRAAVFFDDLELVEYLLSEGANPNARNSKGSSILMLSCYKDRNITITRRLLEHGANIGLVEYHGASAIAGTVMECKSTQHERLSLIFDYVKDPVVVADAYELLGAQCNDSNERYKYWRKALDIRSKDGARSRKKVRPAVVVNGKQISEFATLAELEAIRTDTQLMELNSKMIKYRVQGLISPDIGDESDLPYKAAVKADTGYWNEAFEILEASLQIPNFDYIPFQDEVVRAFDLYLWFLLDPKRGFKNSKKYEDSIFNRLIEHLKYFVRWKQEGIEEATIWVSKPYCIGFLMIVVVSQINQENRFPSFDQQPFQTDRLEKLLSIQMVQNMEEIVTEIQSQSLTDAGLGIVSTKGYVDRISKSILQQVLNEALAILRGLPSSAILSRPKPAVPAIRPSPGSSGQAQQPKEIIVDSATPLQSEGAAGNNSSNSSRTQSSSATSGAQTHATPTKSTSRNNSAACSRSFYQEIRKLDGGAFGTAYLVRRKTDKALVVLKESNLHGISPELRAKSFQEADLLESIRHPNIVMFYGAFEENSCFYIVMEYCSGGNLTAAVKKQIRELKSEPFPEDRIREWSIQLASAVKCLHDSKIIHRDIKGQNIFVMADDSLKLGDLGIARLSPQTAAMSMTRIGTITHAAPEIVNEEPYSTKVDIWALGIVVYELAALCLPFDGATQFQIMSRILSGKRDPIPATANYSKCLCRFVDKLLSVNADDRPTIEQVMTDEFFDD